MECPGICTGHYLKPEEHLAHFRAHGKTGMESKPPSVVIREALNQAQSINHMLTDQEIVELARKTLLSVNEVSMWLDHLAGVAERRKEGAKKAAATRKKRDTFTDNSNQGE
jgi:hypothetical protein